LEFEEVNDSKSTKKRISRVLFCDNGDGMDVDLLHKCLKLGHSSRSNDRSGIGRFGVGMTLGAIHECRRIEVYSKVRSSDWFYTYMDLDEISSGTLTHLPRPIRKDPQENITNYVRNSGTLIIWSKYDKQTEKFDNIVKETAFWLGRTYRKFIWGTATGYSEVQIYLNNVLVRAFDPLFYTKEKTGFESEEKADLTEPQVLQWMVPSDGNSRNQWSDIVINVSLLPESYRRISGKGGDNFAKERFITENEGISILRNDREVFYGLLPHANKLGPSEADSNVNRFIGCEISFRAELDSQFEVKNIKRGAKPVGDLKYAIIEALAPTFRSFREIIRNRWSELDRQLTQKESDRLTQINVSRSHETTNAFLREASRGLTSSNLRNNPEEDVRIARGLDPEADHSRIQLLINALKENGITIDEREFIGDTFIDIAHGNNLKTLIYNTNSNFYHQYKEILDECSTLNPELARKYRVLFDLVFVSYMLAESQIDPNAEMTGSSFANELKSYWSLQLGKILRIWKQKNASTR
jgi:hypothetical protein